MDDKNFTLVAIVAMVAIVAVVALVLSSGKGFQHGDVSVNPDELVYDSEGNLIGGASDETESKEKPKKRSNANRLFDSQN